jgi:hypothetical protein
MRTSQLRCYWMALIVAVASLISMSSIATAQDACYVRLCTDRLPIYTGEDGSRGGVPYARCRTNTSAPAPVAHSLVSCPAGTTLIAQTGYCRRDSCGGGGGGGSCTHSLVCSRHPGFPHYVADSPGPGGVLQARCSADPTGLNWRAHMVASCAAGFTLVPGTGICRQCVGSETSSRALPDLVLRDVWVRTQDSSLRAKALRTATSYLACFTVANVGMVASGAFRVGGGGLGVPVAPHQNHASLLPGATRAGCLTYTTAPPPGSYRLGLTADSLNAVTEMREDNNSSTIDVVVVP